MPFRVVSWLAGLLAMMARRMANRCSPPPGLAALDGEPPLLAVCLVALDGRLPVATGLVGLAVLVNRSSLDRGVIGRRLPGE